MRYLFLVLALFYALGSPAHAREPQEPPRALVAHSPSQQTPAPMLSQGDPAWKHLKIGSGATIGKKGCLVAALFDVLCTIGVTCSSPEAFVEQLSRNRLFTKSGALYWSLDRLFPVSAVRLTLSGATAFNEARRRLEQGASVLLQVATSRGTLHWVVASRVIGDDIEIRDPDGGVVTTLTQRYGRSALRGLAFITQ